MTEILGYGFLAEKNHGSPHPPLTRRTPALSSTSERLRNNTEKCIASTPAFKTEAENSTLGSFLFTAGASGSPTKFARPVQGWPQSSGHPCDPGLVQVQEESEGARTTR